VDVIFEGRLSHELRIETVLRRVLAQGPKGVTFLRISCDQYHGRLLIFDSRFIQGATIAGSDEMGYSAARKLLAIAAGNFAFLRTGSEDEVDVDPDLNLDLEKVIKHVPALPASQSELFDEKSLLDKVFESGPNPILPEAPEGSLDVNKPRRRTIERGNMWKLLQPLAEATDSAELDDFADADSLPDKNSQQNPGVPYILAFQKTSQATKQPAQKSFKSTAFSPVFAITIMLMLLALELVVIIFWKPLVSSFGQHKHSATQAGLRH